LAVATTTNPLLFRESVYQIFGPPPAFDLQAEKTVASGKKPPAELGQHGVLWRISADTSLSEDNTESIYVNLTIAGASLSEEDIEKYGPDSLSVTVEGPFWSQPSTKTIRSISSGSLNWTWVFTPESSGTKKALVTLPPPGIIAELFPQRTTGSEGDAPDVNRLVVVNGEHEDPGSRSVLLTFNVRSTSYLLGMSYQTLYLGFSVVSWFLGPVMSLPWFLQKGLPQMRKYLPGSPSAPDSES